jgi:hypothetical protein
MKCKLQKYKYRFDFAHFKLRTLFCCVTRTNLTNNIYSHWEIRPFSFSDNSGMDVLLLECLTFEPPKPSPKGKKNEVKNKGVVKKQFIISSCMF